MDTGIISREVVAKVAHLSLHSSTVWLLEELERKEPLLYLVVEEMANELTDFYLNNGGKDEALNEFASKVESNLVRIFLLMQVGTFEFWLDIAEMRKALRQLWGKNPGDSMKSGGGNQPPEEPWL